MNTDQIIVRPATRDDAKLIAYAVAMAIGDEKALRCYCGDDYISVLTSIATSDATQYSWQGALIAEIKGVGVGAIVGYDGAKLAELRESTFAIIRNHIERVPSIADETEAGEYYLDSVGVLPEYRNMGVGRELIRAFCDKAFSDGYERVGLIVDCDNPHAERLYTSLGFERVGTRQFFSHKMWHLQHHCPNSKE